MTEDPEDYGYLPDVLAQIAAAAGLDAALKVARARGGTEVYFPAPSRLYRGHWLVECVGRDAAAAICAAFGFGDKEGGGRGGKVRLPVGPAGTLAAARARADRMIARGEPAAKIAGAVGYTTRGIEKRVRKARERGNAPQPDLFAPNAFGATGESEQD